MLLRNHADGIAAVDFLVVPTITFERLSDRIGFLPARQSYARSNPLPNAPCAKSAS
jgi:hypothetical protein